MRSSLMFLLCMVWLLFGPSLYGQMQAPPVTPSLWDGDRLVRLDPAFGDAAHVIQAAGVTPIPMPPTEKSDYRVNDWHQGALWATRRLGREACEVWKHEGKGWERVAFWQADPEAKRRIHPKGPFLTGPSVVHPLRADRFLALTWGRTFFHEGRWYPAAILQRRPEDGRLTVVEPMDLGLELPFLTALEGKQDWRTDLSLHLLGAHVVRVDDRLVIPIPGFGLFAILDAQTGRVRRTARLFDDLEIKDVMSSSLKNRVFPVIGAQPTRHGTLLFAGRSREALLHAATFLSERPKPMPTGPGSEAAYRRWSEEQSEAQRQATQLLDRVDWYELDPITGKITETAPPKGAHTSLRVVRGSLFNFCWRIERDGRVTFRPGSEVMNVSNARYAETLQERGQDVPESIKPFLPKPKPAPGAMPSRPGPKFKPEV